MKNFMFLCISFIFIFTLSACALTPGDAAFQSNHYFQAAKLYRKSAEQGDGLAAIKLASMYYHPPGAFPQNSQKAIYWYKKTIAFGYVPAYWYIGHIYYVGKGNVAKNYKLAEHYFREGAKKGHHYSMYDLADMYAKKQTQTPDDVQGLMWLDLVTSFAKTFSKNNKGAQYILRDPEKVRKTLTSRMSDAQIQKAKNWADRNLKKHNKLEAKNPFPPGSRNIS